MQRVELVHSNQTLVIERTGKDTKRAVARVRGEDILEQPKPQLVSSVLSLANVQVKGFADDIPGKSRPGARGDVRGAN